MKKKGFIIGGICLAAIVGILGYNHEAVRVVFHNVYSPSVKLDDSSKWNGGKAYEKLPYSETSENKPEFCGAIGAGLFAVDSDRLLERLECNALNINPKNLVILFGTNDIGIGVPTEYTLKNIKEILQRTQTLCSNTAVKSSIRA